MLGTSSRFAERAQPGGAARKARGVALAATMVLSGIGVTVGTASVAGAETINSGVVKKSVNGVGNGTTDPENDWCNNFLGTGAPTDDSRFGIKGSKVEWTVDNGDGTGFQDVPTNSNYKNGDKVMVKFTAKKGHGPLDAIFSQTVAGGAPATLTAKLSVMDRSSGPGTIKSDTAPVVVKEFPTPATATSRLVDSFEVSAGPFVMDSNAPDIATFSLTNLEVDSATAPGPIGCNGDFDIAAKNTSFTLKREPIVPCLNPPPAGFTDVADTAYYSTPVDWMKAMGITSGTGAGLYSPSQSVTRAQMAMFLWRQAGSPEPFPAHPYTDVPSGAYYQKALNWADHEGITDGTGPGMFSPNAKVSRAQMAMFLWRANGSPATADPHGFSDIPDAAYYEEAVRWLVMADVTAGTTPHTYSPNDAVSRGQMATFLYRTSC